MLAELFEKHLIDDILIGFLVLCTFVFQHINACIFFPEMSRQQRKGRKKRQKWFWGSVGLAVTLGATAIVWSYLPSSQPQGSADSNSTASN